MDKQTQIIARPEFDKLKVQLTKINEIALEIQQRQIRIINTANIINNKLKNSIEDNIKDTNVITQTEQRIKNLQDRIDKSKTRLSNIREKFLNFKKMYKYQKENIFNL
jgi:predicted transcriptional regulator